MYRLFESADWAGLLASCGVRVGLTIEGQGEEPSQQRKTVRAQALGLKELGVFCVGRRKA